MKSEPIWRGGLLLLMGAAFARSALAAVPCPPAGAALSIHLAALAISLPATVEVSGAVITPSCESTSTMPAYSRQVQCVPSQAGDCVIAVDNLQPGLWSHRVLVTGAASEPQQQWQRTLLLDRSAGTSVVSWQIFPSVVTIRSLADSPACVDCFRSALGTVTAVPKPALIQFAPDLLGSVVRSPALPPLAASDVTIDAVAPAGALWQRTIDGHGLDESALVITGARNTVVGLRFTNVGGNSDLVLIVGGDANANRLSQVQVVGRTLTTCGSGLDGCVVDGVCQVPDVTQPQGVCGDDGVAMRANAGSAGANRIERSDVSGAYDKGIKISDGAIAIVDGSYIHSNRDGGIQATLSGSVTATGNLIENNRGSNSANGLAANGPSAATPGVPAVLATRGNLSRNNSLRGISVRSFSLVALHDDFTCDNGTVGRSNGFGLAVSGDDLLFPSGTVRGFAAAYNSDGGINVAGVSQLDFGTEADAGSNAFVANGVASVPVNFENLAPSAVSAVANQWEHCGAKPVCDEQAIALADTVGPLEIAPAQSHRWNHEARVEAVEPTFGVAGDLVRIYGHGFDAISGQPRGGSCATIAANNRCSPNHGTCVRIGGLDADVVAISPTMLVVRLPTTCVAPTTVSVRSRHGRKRLHTSFCTLP